MFSGKLKVSIISAALFFCSGSLFAEMFVTGITGGKITIKPDLTNDTKKPDVELQSYFTGQANITQNIWTRMNFSLETENLLETAPFGQTQALFQIDELSFTFRQRMDTLNNYFSIFLGSYDPIGSDIFLQRQFGISPISSKVTETWKGASGNLLYPQSGIGICDIFRFSSETAAGFYSYINHDDADYYVFNADLRFGKAKRFFTMDVAAGISTPLATKKYEDVILAVEKVNWHAGTTMLIGNNHTSASLFLQAGVVKGSFDVKKKTADIALENLYLLVEPRFNGTTNKTHVSFYYLPESSISSLLLIHNPLGINVNLFTDKLSTRNSGLDWGINAEASFKNLTLKTFSNIQEELLALQFDVYLTPYVSTKLLKGEISSMISLNGTSLLKKEWKKSVQANIGFKTAF